MKSSSPISTISAAIVLGSFLWLTIPTAAETATDLCDRGTLDAAVGSLTAETFSYGGTDRHYCTYTSSLAGSVKPTPLLIALHGGGGNASIMMSDNKRIIKHAERLGWIAVFPNGLPIDDCKESLCLNNNWEAPDNIFFVAELIDRLKAQRNIRSDRVHLIGFSGGASLIYRIATEPGFPHAIHSIATVAGAIGKYTPETGMVMTQLNETPINALLAQGSLDGRMPEAGGLESHGVSALVSHRTKVDMWRLATGTAAAAGVEVDLTIMDPPAPSTARAKSYSYGSAEVIDLVDTDLEHEWPSWDLMAVIAKFFR